MRAGAQAGTEGQEVRRGGSGAEGQGVGRGGSGWGGSGWGADHPARPNPAFFSSAASLRNVRSRESTTEAS